MRRPGSPVVGLRPARPAVFTSRPASVWVAAAVFASAVRVSDGPAAAPISGGRDGIFARREPTVEQRLACEVVAVCRSEEDARAAADVYAAGHADVSPDMSVTCHTVTDRPAPPAPPPRPVLHACLDCDTPVAADRVRCPAHQARYFEQCRAADPDFEGA